MEPQENHEKIEPITPQQAKPAVGIAGAIITGAAMIALALIIVMHGSNAAPTAALPATGNQQAPAVAPDISKVNIAGEPFIGNANAPVTIAYWFDYQCPFCRQNEQTVMPEIITNYVDSGKVKIVFKDFAFLGPDSQTLGQYARAVWAVDPAKFYAWHDAVFTNQGTENTGWATQSKILSITSSVLGQAETAKVAQDVTTNGAAYQQAMDADKAEAEKFGIEGTPAAIIGTQEITGAEPYANFQSAINAALASKETNS